MILARSVAENRSPKAASRLLRATRRPCRSRWSRERTGDARELHREPTRAAAGRWRRAGARQATPVGSEAISSVTSWRGRSLRAKRRRVISEQSAGGFVDLRTFDFTLAQAVACCVPHHREIRPFCHAPATFAAVPWPWDFSAGCSAIARTSKRMRLGCMRCGDSRRACMPIDVCRKRGVDISSFRSQPLTVTLVDRATHIFAMTGSHLETIHLALSPERG